jgi:GrpB-like predicted nucleotidyltransferase (UPF0157 family)
MSAPTDRRSESADLFGGDSIRNLSVECAQHTHRESRADQATDCIIAQPWCTEHALDDTKLGAVHRSLQRRGQKARFHRSLRRYLRRNP